MFTPKEMIASYPVPLPEDIQKLKWAGEMEEAIDAIDRRVQGDIPELLRRRLMLERERLRRLPLQYPYTREQEFGKIRELIPDVTESEFREMELDGKLDYIFWHGEKRFFVRAHTALLRRPEYVRRADPGASPVSPWLDPMIETIRKSGRLARRIELMFSIRPEEAAWKEGVYRAWLPYPLERDQQREVRLLEGAPQALAPGGDPARTAYFEGPLNQGEAFSVRLSYVNDIRYADPLNAPAPANPLYPDAPAPTEEDLAETPWAPFSPLLVSLARDVTVGAESPLEKAARIYDFITTRVRYSFVRGYFNIDNHAEFCALNMRGDCGLQALLFITLCRISGIPARWQSGCSLSENGVGSHDWAQFYLDGWGWLFADPSFGGGAFRMGSESRRAFYFGNLDPMRLAAAHAFMAEFTPESHLLRLDPTDNQSGEIELAGSDLPFTGPQVWDEQRLIRWEDVE